MFQDTFLSIILGLYINGYKVDQTCPNGLVKSHSAVCNVHKASPCRCCTGVVGGIEAIYKDIAAESAAHVS